jgi:cobalt-zinc-cadmium efflux system outer membrane protein
MIAIWKYFPLVGLVCLAGCAVHRYQPAPIIPSATALRFESRSLADPGLQSFEEQNLGHPISPPPTTWDLQTLSLAALYFHPTLDSARARIAGTEAAVVTAGARPNPSFSVAPGIPSPYLLTLDFAIPIETADKRTHRVHVARSLDQAARFDLADLAWTIRSGVRTALLNCIIASRNLELFRDEEKIREDQVKIMEEIFLAGEIPRQNLDASRIDLSRLRLAISSADGQVADAKGALAAAIGIPWVALQDVDFSWSNIETLPRAESLLLGDVNREAVLNRLDLRRSLAQYAAAEASLQLEIAKQYPDINLGPGYTYEEKHSFFTVGLSTTIPLFNRNEGPIAEAEAHRKEAAAAFLERQAKVIGRSERAFATYEAALKEQMQVESIRKLEEIQLQITQQAIEGGTDNRLSLDNLKIQSSVSSRARLDALAHAQRALGELEDAIQRPLDGTEIFTITPEVPALTGPTKKLKR